MLFYVSNENYELRIANYTQVIHSIVQYALLHNILYLGGEKYFRNQNSKYTLAEYNNGYFTAKIQGRSCPITFFSKPGSMFKG